MLRQAVLLQNLFREFRILKMCHSKLRWKLESSEYKTKTIVLGNETVLLGRILPTLRKNVPSSFSGWKARARKQVSCLLS
jgi:hypothetical protein